MSNKVKLESLSRAEKVALYAAGTAQELEDMGLIEAGHALTGPGLGMFKQLLESGFKPTTDELCDACQALIDTTGISVTDNGLERAGELLHNLSTDN